MTQKTLLDFIGQPEKRYVCSRCGREFKTARGLNNHITRKHVGDSTPPLYYGEGVVDVKDDGSFIDVRIRMKKTLWDSIKKTVEFEGVKLDEAIIGALVNLTTSNLKKPSYIT